MYTCADCTVVACAAETKENLPKNCPMRNEENMREIYAEYEKEENHRFYTVCSSIEAQGYCQWPRLEGNHRILQKHELPENRDCLLQRFT